VPMTVLVEPHPSGHRFQAVANVALLAAGTSDVVLLTSAGATASEEFATYLADVPIKVEERFADILPPTREQARAIAQLCRAGDVATVVLMDADQALKRWWFVAPRELRRLPRRPRVVFMLTRYPARLSLTDRTGWKLRISKAILVLAAMAGGRLHRVAGFAGREDLTRGWLVKRARDPASCLAHSRDRARLRAELGLPPARKLVGIFGVLTDRKHAPLVLSAIEASGCAADLVLAGRVKPDVAAWLDTLPDAVCSKVIVRDGFLPNPTLDALIASVDAVAIVMTNNGPSGIMGKALAAGVPVVSAGSTVRARELAATGNGEATALTGDAVGAAIHRLLTGEREVPRTSRVPPATGETFAATVLGLDGS
jgi:glycosyltransferase involved in cell wall biosynthesis